MCLYYLKVIDRDVELALIVALPTVLATRFAWMRWAGGQAARVSRNIMIVCCALIVSGSCSMGYGFMPAGWWWVVKAAGLLSVMFVVEIVRVRRLKSGELPHAIVVEEKTKPERVLRSRSLM